MVKSLSSVVSASRVDASDWEGGQSLQLWREMFRDRRNSNRITLTRARWVEGKGKKVQYLINKRILFDGKHTICRARIHQDPIVE